MGPEAEALSWFASYVKRVREAETELTQAALAARMKRSARTVLDMENGKHLPTPQVMFAWERALGEHPEAWRRYRAVEEARALARYLGRELGDCDIMGTDPAPTGGGPVNRRQFATLATAMPAALAFSADEGVRGVIRHTATLRRWYRVMSGQELRPAVEGHLELACNLLRRSPREAEERQLKSVLAESYMLLGWLLYWDYTDLASADQALRLALRAAGEADDSALMALLIGLRANVDYDSGAVGRGLGRLEIAGPLAERKAPTAIRSFLSALAAEGYAQAGDRAGQRSSLDHARKLLERTPADELDRWRGIGEWSAARLHGYESASFTRLKDGRAAEHAILQGIGRYDRARDPKDHGLYVAHLAHAYALQGEVEQACVAVADAFGLGIDAGQPPGVIPRWIRNLLANELAPYGDAAPVVELRQRLVAA